jgi:hypothetical protein
LAVNQLKEKEFLRVVEEINEIRRYRPMITSEAMLPERRYLNEK